MKKSLTNAPFTIDATAIAKGLLNLFTEEERTVLRFGMLPAEKMNACVRMLREKFLETATSKGGDAFTGIRADGHCVDFSMKRLVAEAVHEIALELYAIGELVV